MDALNALTPLASVFFGAGITHSLNVRGRRRSLVEDSDVSLRPGEAAPYCCYQIRTAIGLESATDHER